MGMPGSRRNKEIVYKLKKKEISKVTSDKLDQYFSELMDNLMILIGEGLDEEKQKILRKDVLKLQYIQNVINSLYE